MTDQRGLFDAEPAEPKPPPPRGFTEAVRRQMVAAGYMDGPTGATRKARATRCRDCGKPVWQGIDKDWGGSVRTGDPGPLTPLGEAQAKFFGWNTLCLAWLFNRHDLYLRDQFMIAGTPAGTEKNRDILAEHKCDVSSAALSRGPTRLPTYEPEVVSDVCPF